MPRRPAFPRGPDAACRPLRQLKLAGNPGISMPQAVISGTGLYQPPHIVTNAELVQAFNAYAEAHNTTHAEAIARGDQMAMVGSSVEFIEKASGIKQRYVIEKEGVLDPA